MEAAPVSAGTIATAIGAELHGDDRSLEGLATLSDPKPAHLVFASDAKKYAEQVTTALAAGSVVIVPRGFSMPESGTGTALLVDNPRAAYAVAVTEFFAPRTQPGISATAVVHESAQIDPTAYIGEFTVIGPGVRIGAATEIRNHAVIGRNVQVGASALIKSHAVIGEEGFGIDQDSAGNNMRLPHLGSVIVGDHVEIGNFTTVCSGTIAPTLVDDYAKIDDHVHISHNCRIGRNAIITACAEISGSVTIGERAWIGPNASLIQGISVGDDALIGIGAVVTRSVPGNEVQFGNPAKRFRDNHPAD